ncbi:hypothetical protein [Paenibacillus sp. FSL E2-0201]|uniref:hypothetical protein n=1 Tax=Paenibacillus sp. FSL E2-0201 TaxID=2954726 RepID=UPI0030D7E28C
MIEDVVINENAYFYRKIKTLSKTYISRIFTNVSKKKVGPYLYNSVKDTMTLTNGHSIVFSLCIFKYEAKPSFLNNERIKEIKLSFLLIVEFDNYIIISKKSISGLDDLLKGYTQEIDYSILSNLFVEDSTQFEKLSMNNMDVSDNVIRSKNLMARDLKESISPFNSSGYILRNIRLVNKDEKISLALNTSKIGKLGNKSNLDIYFTWVTEVINKVNTSAPKETFLNNFSSPSSFEDDIEQITPISILFILEELFRWYENGEIQAATYKGREINLLRFLKRYEKVLPIQEEQVLGYKRYNIKNKYDNSLKLKINKSAITLTSTMLKHVLFVDSNDEQFDLLTYFNKTQNYKITFNDVGYIYWSKKLFKDHRMLGNLDYFFKAFITNSRLKSCTSEKGGTNLATSSFTNNSIFNFIETHMSSGATYLFCDDLGNEWADYIEIRSHESVSFYHAKHGKVGLSASNFHDVVSQAQKNLGNIYTSSVALNKKKTKWKSMYNNSEYPSSNIKRIRKGNQVERGLEMFIKTILAPNTKKQVYLVVNFISLSDLKSQLLALRNGNTSRLETTQIFWLIQSYILSCKELNVDGYIVCAP